MDNQSLQKEDKMEKRFGSISLRRLMLNFTALTLTSAMAKLP